MKRVIEHEVNRQLERGSVVTLHRPWMRRHHITAKRMRVLARELDLCELAPQYRASTAPKRDGAPFQYITAYRFEVGEHTLDAWLAMRAELRGAA